MIHTEALFEAPAACPRIHKLLSLKNIIMLQRFLGQPPGGVGPRERGEGGPRGCDSALYLQRK